MIIPSVLLIVAIIAWAMSERPALPNSFLHLKNEGENTAPIGWPGTPIDRKGRFVNTEFPFYQNYLHILWWLPSHLVCIIRNKSERFQAIDASSDSFLTASDTMMWLGHASFFLNLSGHKILVDPHFYNTFLYSRHTNAPVPSALFSKIDLLLLTHDHADHFDIKSISEIVLNNPKIKIIAGLGTERLLRKFLSADVEIQTTAWYEASRLFDDLTIHFVPSRHYSKRAFRKFNSNLWGGFVIRHFQKDGLQTIYIAGDSGYGRHFKEIGELLNPDIAVLGIGAYKPRWFMEPNHMSPQECLTAFTDTGAKILIPMHYGTFNLSNERMSEPPATLEKLFRDSNTNSSNILMQLQPGVVVSI